MKKFLFLLLFSPSIADDVIVSFDPSPTPGVTYNIYWSPSPFPFSATPSTNISTTNVVVKDIFVATNFKVTAVNSLGYESLPTPIVTYVPQNIVPPSNLVVKPAPKKP